MQELDLNEDNTDVECSHFAKGGGTGREYPINLIRKGTEAWNKWFQFESEKTWAMLKSKQGIWTFRGFGIKSANDCPHRDPKSVVVSIVDPSTG